MNAQPRMRPAYWWGIGLACLVIAAWLAWARWDTLSIFERARIVGAVSACYFACGGPFGFIAGWIARRLWIERGQRAREL
jgi:hypothetical protein